DNLKVLDGGQRVLSSLLLVQAKVDFLPRRHGATSLDQMSAALEQFGMRLLRLSTPEHTSFLESTLLGQTPPPSQLVSAEAIYIPNESRLTALDTNQRLKLALLLHTVHGIADLAAHILGGIDSDTMRR